MRPAPLRFLNEDSGEALAIACKGAGISRAVFSTLALLAYPAANAWPNAWRLG